MLPFVVTLGSVAFCVHGGIGPHCSCLEEIAKIKLPLDAYEPGDIVTELVWSDPAGDEGMFEDSARGLGVRFGLIAVRLFLKQTGFQKLIRAHQCVQTGIEMEGPTYTIFSSSNYCGQGNSAAMVKLDERGHMNIVRMEPFAAVVEREQAYYLGVRPTLLRPRASSDLSSFKLKGQGLGMRPNPLTVSRRDTMKGLRSATPGPLRSISSMSLLSPLLVCQEV
jgi:hypothetical protein